ncbi:MAG: ABC transporter ATP-binding protein [Oscillospiraceae bacterium]
MDNGALEVKDLTFSYGEKQVLCHFDLSIAQGEWVAIMGKSGCGKSTLLSNICGLAQKIEGATYQGKISFFGKEIESYSRSELAKTIGVVFQNASNRLVAPTVEEEIWFGLQNLCLDKKEIIDRADKVIQELGLEKVRKDNPSRLSGGQQQLVSFGAVVAMMPKIYLFDEVTSQFDTTNRNLVLEKIRRLNQEGATIIMVEHSTLVSENAQRKIVLEGLK